MLLGNWSLTGVLQLQSGFPMGSARTSGTFLFSGTIVRTLMVSRRADGDITSRIEDNTTDNQYFNQAAFQAVAKNQFGNAPRTLPDVLSPFRTSFSMSAAKQVNLPGRASLSVRVEVLNMFNIVQWAAPASAAFGNSAFGQIRNQANNMRSYQFTLRLSY